MKGILNTICLVLLLLVISESDFKLDFSLPAKPDMVVVVYESSDNIPEPYVTGALLRIQAGGLQTRIFDKDVVTGTGAVPTNLKGAIEKAVENGLPALVVLANGKVVNVQDLPKTESEIIEAVK